MDLWPFGTRKDDPPEVVPAPGPAPAPTGPDLQAWMAGIVVTCTEQVRRQLREEVERAQADLRAALALALQEVRGTAQAERAEVRRSAGDSRAAIETSMSRARTDLTRQAEHELARIAGGSDGATATVARPAERTERRLADVERLIQDHQRILDTIRARGVEDDPDLTREDFLVHYHLAEQLKALFTQRLPELTDARLAYERAQGQAPDALWREAQLVRQLCLALFGGPAPDLDAVTQVATAEGRVPLSGADERRLARVRREATDLVTAVAGSGHEAAFVFELPPATLADPDLHELWTSSRPGHPVAFVVTPGYEAAGRRVLPPAVITTDRAGSAAGG